MLCYIAHDILLKLAEIPFALDTFSPNVHTKAIEKDHRFPTDFKTLSRAETSLKTEPYRTCTCGQRKRKLQKR